MSLTKDSMMTELLRNGVECNKQMNKQQIQKLYAEHCQPDLAIFSSDDEEGQGQGQGQGTPTRSTKGSRSSRRSNVSNKSKAKGSSPSLSSLDESSMLTVGDEDVSQLDDQQLFNRLKELGVDVGPIVASTRHLYQKKLALLLRQQLQGDSNGHSPANGHSNGLDQYSADEDELENGSAETDDDQPAPVVTIKKESPGKKASNTSMSLRNRFMGNSPGSSSSPTERFTPTPRRSIHSYKVTEQTKRTMTKTPDGNIAHDYSYQKFTSEDDIEEGVGVKFWLRHRLLPNLPRFFLLLIIALGIYYSMKDRI